LDNRERLHNVVHVISLDPVQMEERGIQLSPHCEASLFIPPKRCPRISEIMSERLHIPCRIGQLKNTPSDPRFDRINTTPGGRFAKDFRSGHRQLLEAEVVHVYTRYLLSHHIIHRE